MTDLVSSESRPDLRRSLADGRSLRSSLLTLGAWAVALLAAVPLFSVLYMLVVNVAGTALLALTTRRMTGKS